MSIRIALNVYHKDAVVFFCRESGMHLSLSKRIGVTNKVTPSILRGLRAGKLIDVDKVLDFNNCEVEELNKSLEVSVKPVKDSKPKTEVVEEAAVKKTEAKKKTTKSKVKNDK